MSQSGQDDLAQSPNRDDDANRHDLNDEVEGVLEGEIEGELEEEDAPGATPSVRPAVPPQPHTAAPVAEQAAFVEEQDPPAFDFDALAVSAASTVASPSRRPVSRIPQHKAGGGLKATAAPILLTVGLLLLIPGVWSLLILSGSPSAWGADREDAKGMATIMLACWPIILILIASSVLCFVQVMNERKKATQKPGLRK